MKRRLWVVGVWVAASLVFLAVSCQGTGSVGSEKGKEAPDFSLPTLDGGADNLRNYRGRTVILNFWATWCGPCRAEMPDIQAVFAQMRDRGVVVLAVNQGESREKVAEFAREFGLTFPILLDENRSVGNQYGVRAYPTTLFIDKNGVVRQVTVGGLTRAAILRQLEGLLK